MEFDLRESYSFDLSPLPGGWKYGGVFAADDERRTFYVKAGLNGGARLLAHQDPDGHWYAAERLHAECLRRVVSGDLANLFAHLGRAADQWGEKPPARLAEIENAGFEAGFDKERWYTRSVLAMELPAPGWAPEAAAWDIREGILLRFPDGTSRLVPRRQYYQFADVFTSAPLARQGDLLLYQDDIEADGAVRLDSIPCSGKANLDRHVITSEKDDDGTEILVAWHPEHETLRVPMLAKTAVLAPGTSRPFESGRTAYGD